MAGEGEKLRAARQAKGWSLTDVEEKTKIQIRYLQALEEENYGILPGAAYIKGFLRTYANYLGLNQEEILADYKASVKVEPEPVVETPLKPIRSRSVWFRPAVVVVMALVAIGAVLGIAHFLKTPDNSNNGYEPSALPTPPSQSNTNNQQPSASSGNNDQNSVNPSGQDNTNQTPPQTTAPVETEGLDAKITINALCWTRVKIDDGQPIDEMYQPGTVKELKAKTKIEFVTIGNPGGITINLNGHDLPAFGQTGQPVNNYILTADTLKNLGQ